MDILSTNKQNRLTEMDREISLSQKRKEQRKLIFRYGAIVVGIVITILVIISLLKGSISIKNMVVGSVDRRINTRIT